MGRHVKQFVMSSLWKKIHYSNVNIYKMAQKPSKWLEISKAFAVKRCSKTHRINLYNFLIDFFHFWTGSFPNEIVKNRSLWEFRGRRGSWDNVKQGDLTPNFPKFSKPILNLDFYINADPGSTQVSNIQENSVEFCTNLRFCHQVLIL